MLPELKYTLCFIRNGSYLLMLLRNNPPNAGWWNGVGGKIEPGETPLASVCRKVHEEVGIQIHRPIFKGIVTWTGDIAESVGGGMYVYVANWPANTGGSPWDLERVVTAEGVLSWVHRDDIRNWRVPVVDNIPYFLPKMLDLGETFEYRCIYHRGELLSVTRLHISQEIFDRAYGREVSLP